MATYRFDEIAINSTKKKKPTEEDKAHYIGLEHIDPGCFNIVRWGSDVAPTGDKLLMQKGDVLFGKRRAYQRKVGIAPFDGIFSAHGMVLRPNTKIIDTNYFPFFISSDRFMETAVRISVGGLSPTINWKDLAKQEFDVPSLEEQKVLAEKLWVAYRLKEGYKKLLAATDEMVKAQFIEMFGGGKYKQVKLGDYTDLTWGDTNTTKNSYVECGYIAYSAGGPDGQLDHFDYDREGIVLSAIGADCGKTWYATGKWSCIKNTIRFWSISEDLDNYYLYLATNGKEYWPRRGGAQPFIPQGEARNCKIPLPPISLQKSFISICNQADKSKFELRKSIDAIDKVIKSLINN